LLMRHTGMRIGECADLAYDCLHNVGPGPRPSPGPYPTSSL
jgi:hypothetical protein